MQIFLIPLKNSGVSIVESLVAVSVLLISVGAASYAFSAMVSQVSRAEHHLYFSDFSQEVKTSLSDVATCSGNFIGKTIPTLGLPTAIDGIVAIDENGAPSGTIVSAGEKRDRFDILEMNLSFETALPGSRSLINLEVKSTSKDGSRELLQQIPIIANVDAGGLIVSCYALQNGTADLEKSSCSISSNGTLTWDPATNQCTDKRQWEWQPSDWTMPPSGVLDPYFAQCEDGWQLDYCGYYALEPGYKDPLGFAETTILPDGSIVEGPSKVQKCVENNESQSCTCQYLTQLPDGTPFVPENHQIFAKAMCWKVNLE